MTGSNAVILAYTVGVALILAYAARTWMLQRRLNRRAREQSAGA